MLLKSKLPLICMGTVNSLQIEKGSENLMVQWRNMLVEGVQLKDVPTWLSREECVEDMVQRSRFVAMKDVPTKLGKEESVEDMVQM